MHKAKNYFKNLVGRKEEPEESCSTCQVGADTLDQYPGTCPHYKKAEGRHCVNYRRLGRKKDERVVYIASPLRGDIEGNLIKATAYCAAAAKAGVTPIAPHLYFSSFLDDTIKEERIQGMDMGITLLDRCDELWVFGRPSAGMQAEIERAEKLGIKVKHIDQKTIKQILRGGRQI